MQAAAKDREEVRLELPSEPGSIKRARDAVASLAERVGVPANDVKLAGDVRFDSSDSGLTVSMSFAAATA